MNRRKRARCISQTGPIFIFIAAMVRGKMVRPARPIRRLSLTSCCSAGVSFRLSLGVALLFVSADRFVGKGTAHARFATFRYFITYNIQCTAARLLGHGILSTREQDVSREFLIFTPHQSVVV